MNEQIQVWLESSVSDFLILVSSVSTAILSVAWLIDILWRRKSAAVAYRIWLAAFLLVMFVPVGMSAVPKWKIMIPVPEFVNKCLKWWGRLECALISFKLPIGLSFFIVLKSQ